MKSEFQELQDYLQITTEDVLISGGAKGADTLWGEIAENLGHEVIHFSFMNHTYMGHKKEYQVQVPGPFLRDADYFLSAAAPKLDKKYKARDSYVNNLLRRNYYQINKAEMLFAICEIINDVPQGGTAWAIQMFIDRCNREETSRDIFVYSESNKQWYKYSFNDHEFTEIIQEEVPYPESVYAGIGSREITNETKEYMKKFFRRTSE